MHVRCKYYESTDLQIRKKHSSQCTCTLAHCKKTCAYMPWELNPLEEKDYIEPV